MLLNRPAILTVVFALILGIAVGKAWGSPTYCFDPPYQRTEVIYIKEWEHLRGGRHHFVIMSNGTRYHMSSAEYIDYFRTGIFPLRRIN